MSSFRPFALICALIACLFCEQSLAQTEARVIVNASARIKGGKYQIWFTLRNQMAEPVDIANYDIPWESDPTLVVVLYDLTRKVLLQRGSTPFKDPSVGKVTLPPGGTVEGGAYLWEFYTDFDKRVEKSDVLVFWFYKGSDNPVLEPQGGCFVVRHHR